MLAEVTQQSYDCINLIYEIFCCVSVCFMQSDLTLAVCNLNEDARLYSIIGILYITVIADKTAC